MSVQKGILSPDLDDYKTINSYKGYDHQLSPETVHCLSITAEVLVAAYIHNMMKVDL